MGLEKIIEYKKRLGLTTEELSQASGVPIGTLNKILSGATKDPKIETLKSIARVLGLTLNDFDDTSSNEYYTDPETARMAQEMFEDPEMRSLYHMKRNMTPERFQRQMEQFKDMYRLEHPEDSDFGC